VSWKVIQTRWIRHSNYNNSMDLAEFGRKKQAFGEVKAQLNSHIEMLLKHDYINMIVEAEEAIVDENSVTFVDADDYPLYHCRFEAIELDPKPKVPKINIIKELEKLIELYLPHIDRNYDNFFNDIYDLVEKVKEKSASRA